MTFCYQVQYQEAPSKKNPDAPAAPAEDPSR